MPDLSDAFRMIRELQAEVRRLRTPIQLENSSITDGRMRFIGGLLRVDSGGRVEIVGTLQIDGTTTVTGTFTVSGPWEMSGNGTITGDVTATGKWTQNGEWEFNGDGDITGDVDLTGDLAVASGGSVTVSGSNPIVLRQEGGAAKVKVGATGEISGSDSGIQMMVPGSPNRRFVVTPSNLMIVGVSNVTDPPAYYLGMDENGTLRRYASSLGGPGGGPLEWPFPESLVTSEFGPRDGGFHEGIDFGTGIAGVEGTPIPAAAAGTVVEAVTLHSGWGNYVKVSHGNGLETLYAHMVNPPSVTVGQHVARRQTLGGIGNTGNSFGNHLHFEVWVNGSTVNPRTKLPS